MMPLPAELQESFIDEKTALGNWLDELIESWTQGAQIDPLGCVWLEEDRLNKSIRIGPLIDMLKFRPGRHEAKTLQETVYFRGPRLAEILDSIVYQLEKDQTAELSDRSQKTHRIRTNAEVAKEFYLILRDSGEARARQQDHFQTFEATRSRLKKMRIHRRAQLTDELTGEPLRKTEFFYIRQPSFYPELADDPENGLVVNEDTSLILGARLPAGESELITLCKKFDWSTGWVKPFRETAGQT